jgi:hypothetical protein
MERDDLLTLRNSPLGRFVRRHERTHRLIHATWCRTLGSESTRRRGITTGGTPPGGGGVNSLTLIIYPNSLDLGTPIQCTGYALDSSSNPVSGVNVTVSGNGVSGNNPTDAAGFYQVSATPTQTGNIEVTAKAGSVTSNTVVITVGSASAATVTLQGTPTSVSVGQSVQFTGNVTDSTGQGIGSVTVNITTRGVGMNASVTTDQSGFFAATIDMTAAGSYAFVAASQGVSSAAVIISVSGTPPPGQFTFANVRQASLGGLIGMDVDWTNGTGAAINAVVWFITYNSIGQVITANNETIQFSLGQTQTVFGSLASGLPPGTYKIISLVRDASGAALSGMASLEITI